MSSGDTEVPGLHPCKHRRRLRFLGPEGVANTKIAAIGNRLETHCSRPMNANGRSVRQRGNIAARSLGKTIEQGIGGYPMPDGRFLDTLHPALESG